MHQTAAEAAGIAGKRADNPLTTVIRRCRLRRFPYSVIYPIKAGEVPIWAVAHRHSHLSLSDMARALGLSVSRVSRIVARERVSAAVDRTEGASQ